MEVEIVKVVTLGPPEAGKTQLKRALTGNMQESSESTPLSTGAEVIMETFVDGGVKWEKLGKAELQVALYNTVDTKSYNKKKSVLNNPRPENTQQNPVGATTASSSTDRPTLNPNEEDSNSEEENTDSLYQKFSQLRENVLSNLSKSRGNKQLRKVRFVHFIDSGGQPSFFDVHPVVATSRAVYLIVYNSAEGLSVCPKITYRKPRDFPTKELPNPNQTNRDMIKRSLITLHHCKERFVQMEERFRRSLNSECISNKRLPVMFVGTKKKMWLQDNSGPIDKSLRSFFSSYPSLGKNLLFDSHFVDSLDPSCEGVVKLHKSISDTPCKFNLNFPLKWFYCQLVFWSANDSAFSVLSYANLKELCIQGGFVSDDEMFHALLITFHMLGIFSCPDLDDVNASKDQLHCSPVFTKPDVLYEHVSTILAVPFRDLKAHNLTLTMQDKHDLEVLQNTGIITEESLTLLGVPDTIGSFTSFHDYLLKFLLQWGLAAELKNEGSKDSSPTRQQLFIPSILPPCQGSTFSLPDCPIPQFALTICDEKSKEYYIPQGLFPHFIVNIMNRYEQGYIVPEGVGKFTPRCSNVIAITKRALKGTKYPYTAYVADNIDHVGVHIQPDRLNDKDSNWSKPDCYKILNDLKNSMEEAYNQLYGKKEHSSVILACECSCPLAKEEKEKTKETHLGRLDCQEGREFPVIYCLSRLQRDCEVPCTGTLRDILWGRGEQWSDYSHRGDHSCRNYNSPDRNSSPVHSQRKGGSPVGDQSQRRDRSPVQDRSHRRDRSPVRDHSHRRDRSPVGDQSQRRDRSPVQDRSPVRDHSHRRDRSPVQDHSQRRDRSPVQDHSQRRDRSPVQDHSQRRDRSPVGDQSRRRDRSPVQDHSQRRDRSPVGDQSQRKDRSPVQDHSQRRDRSPVQDHSQRRDRSPVQDHSHRRYRSPVQDHSQRRDRSPVQDHSQRKDRSPVRDHSHRRDRSHRNDRSHRRDRSPVRDHSHRRDRSPVQDHSHRRDRSHRRDHSPVRDHSHRRDRSPVGDQSQRRDRSPVQDHSQRRDRSPVGDQSRRRDRSPVQDHSQRRDRSPVGDQSQRKDRSPVQDHSQRRDRSPVQDHSQRRDRSPVQDHSHRRYRSPVQDHSQRRDRSPVQDHSQRKDRSPVRDHSHRRDRSPVQDHSHRRDRSHRRDHSPVRDHSHRRDRSPVRDQSQRRDRSPELTQSDGRYQSREGDHSLKGSNKRGFKYPSLSSHAESRDVFPTGKGEFLSN